MIALKGEIEVIYQEWGKTETETEGTAEEVVVREARILINPETPLPLEEEEEEEEEQLKLRDLPIYQYLWT